VFIIRRDVRRCTSDGKKLPSAASDMVRFAFATYRWLRGPAQCVKMTPTSSDLPYPKQSG